MTAIKYSRRAIRRSTSTLRTLPDFLVIGGMRCGSSSLHTWLGGHPDLELPDRKEIHYFDFRYERGLGWYRSHFPLTSKGLSTFETTPSYMVHPLAAARAASLLPDARLIALVREPTQRAWSHYRHRRSEGYEHRSFEDAVEPELSSEVSPELEPFSVPGEIPYLAAGRYADQLVPWIARYGQDRLLVVDSDRMFVEPAETLDRILDFVGLRRVSLDLPHLNASPPASGDPDVLARLNDYYEEPNRDLRALVEEPIGWLDGVA